MSMIGFVPCFVPLASIKVVSNTVCLKRWREFVDSQSCLSQIYVLAAPGSVGLELPSQLLRRQRQENLHLEASLGKVS
jgi:hypothetical protein